MNQKRKSPVCNKQVQIKCEQYNVKNKCIVSRTFKNRSKYIYNTFSNI